MLHFVVILALFSTISCQYYGSGTSSGSCAVTATSFGCAKYRVLIHESAGSNFLIVNPDGSFTGFIWDLLNLLKTTANFNFTVSLSLQAEGGYGSQDANGVWNGLVGQLVRNETDVVIADFLMTSQRLTAIDFTVPFMPDFLVVVSQANASLTGIKYAVLGDSADFTYLRDSRESRAQAIWASVQANLPTSVVQDDPTGMALVRQGGWAYVAGEAAVVSGVQNSNGQLVINRPSLHTSYLGLGVQLGSPLNRPLSIAVTKAIATGQIQQLLTKWGLALKNS